MTKMIEIDIKRLGDATEEISKAELYLIRRVVEKSSDLVKARHWPEFAQFCGGLKKLQKDHADALLEFEAWNG